MMRVAGHTVLEIPVLETERLRLRAPVPADFPAHAAWCASERSRPLDGPFTVHEAEAKLQAVTGHWARHGFGRWVVADKATDAALGVVGLLTVDGWPEPELAWTVFEAAEGRGIAHEAALAARCYAYEALGWTTVCSLIDEGNARSQALATRLGARPERTCTILGDVEVMLWRHPSPEELAA